jgi:hypothetical protein
MTPHVTAPVPRGRPAQGPQDVLHGRRGDPAKTRANDIAKIHLYHQVGISNYVMIDEQKEDGPRSLVHYRRESAGYVAVPVPENGVLLQAAHVRLRLRASRVVCLDARPD